MVPVVHLLKVVPLRREHGTRVGAERVGLVVERVR